MGIVSKKLKLKKNEGRSKRRRGPILLCLCVNVGGEGRRRWFSDGINWGRGKKEKKKSLFM